MSHHVIQQLKVLGPETQKVVELLAGPDTPVDFNRIFPIPQELHVEMTSEGNVGIAALTGNCERYLTFPWVSNQGITTPEEFRTMAERDYPLGVEFARQLLRNKEKFGAMEWKEWCLLYWKTPWNAYSVGEWEFLPNQATIRFTTRDRIAFSVYMRLCCAFTSTAFELRFFCEDLSYGGEALFRNGQAAVEDIQRGENAERVYQIYREVNGKEMAED